jgi:hypothetical protein
MPAAFTKMITDQEILLALKNDKTLFIPSRLLNTTIDKAKGVIAKEFTEEFAKQFEKNIKFQLDSIEKRPKIKLDVHGNRGSLREEIKKSIKLEIDRGQDGDAKLTATITIDHPLAHALNDGTGIYGARGVPITAKTRRYMFIPGVEFAQNLRLRQLRKQGVNAPRTQVRSEVLARREKKVK